MPMLRVTRLAPAAILLACLALSACASRLSEEDCRAGDWETIGYRDGVDGQPLSRVEDRIGRCAEFGVSLDRALYLAGRDRGLAYFCSPRGALEAGLDGRGDINQCLGADPLARQAYRAAERYRDAQREVTSLQSRIDRAQYVLRTADDRIYRLRRELRREKDEKDAKRLIRQIDDVREDRRRALDELPWLLANYATAQIRLRSVENDYYDAERQVRRFEIENPGPPAPIDRTRPVPRAEPAGAGAPQDGPVKGNPAPEVDAQTGKAATFPELLPTDE